MVRTKNDVLGLEYLEEFIMLNSNVLKRNQARRQFKALS